MKIVFNSRRKTYKGLNWVWAFILIGLTSTIMAAVTQTPEKEYTFKAPLSKYVKADKWISIAKQALAKSDLPSRDVSMILDSLTEFQNAVVVQVNSQLEADKKLEKPTSKTDSTSKKTN